METILNLFGLAIIALGIMCLLFGSKMMDLIPWFSRMGEQDELFIAKSVIILLTGLGIISIISWNSNYLITELLIVSSMALCILIVHAILNYRDKQKLEVETAKIAEQNAIQKKAEEEEQKKKIALEYFMSGIYDGFVRDNLTFKRISTESWLSYFKNAQISYLINYSEIKKQATWNPDILRDILREFLNFHESQFNDENLKVFITFLSRFMDEVAAMSHKRLQSNLNDSMTSMSQYYLDLKAISDIHSIFSNPLIHSIA